ncbi:MAG: inositol monophosphatase family protein, partial [Beijerinckiaceae bacterium]
GNSPVTEADMAVDAFLRQRLMQSAPDFHWLSEEAEHIQPDDDRPAFIVDPIDGTRAFAAGEPQWGISMALVAQGAPVLGVFFMPARDRLYTARRGGGADCNGELLKPDGESNMAAGPQPVLAPFLANNAGLMAHPKIPSLAARVVYVADGFLAVGIASTGAHEWDIAAADLILRETGGQLTDLSGHPLRYTGEARSLPVLFASRRPDHAQLAAGLAAALGKEAMPLGHETKSVLANQRRA